MTIYHFCAMRQGVLSGELSYFSRVVTRAGDLVNAEQYTSLRDAITSQFSGTGDVVILSLSILSRENT